MNVESAEQTKEIDVQDLYQENYLAMQVKTREKKSEIDVSVTKLKENLSIYISFIKAPFDCSVSMTCQKLVI